MIASAVGVALVGMMLVAGVPSATASGPDCREVTALGVKGDYYAERLVYGAHLADNPAAPNDPFGNVNAAMADSISARLPKGALKRVAVPFAPPNITADDVSPAAYRASIASEVDGLQVAMDKETSLCPTTKLVVLGYSTGAQAVHEAIMHIPPSVDRLLAAVILTSDPLADPSDAAVQHSAGLDASPQSGGGWMVDHAKPQDDPYPPYKHLRDYGSASPLPVSLQGRVLSLCNNNDEECRAPADVPNAQNPRPSYLSPRFTSPAAQFASDSFSNLCADVTFFAARGSGESATGAGETIFWQNKKPNDGFGPELDDLAYAVENLFPADSGTTFGYVPVNYDAISVPDAEQVRSGYPASVMTAIAPPKGPKQLQDLETRCPHTMVVMLGFSQGAHAIHEILLELTPAQQSRIVASVLVADADRNPDDAAALTFMGGSLHFELSDSVIYNGMGAMRMVGMADRACLASDTFTKFLGAVSFFALAAMPSTIAVCDGLLPTNPRFSDVVSTSTYPASMTHAVLNVCSHADTVCDVTQKGELPSVLLAMEAEKAFAVGDVHGNGYQREAFFNFPAKWTYSRILRAQAMAK